MKSKKMVNKKSNPPSLILPKLLGHELVSEWRESCKTIVVLEVTFFVSKNVVISLVFSKAKESNMVE